MIHEPSFKKAAGEAVFTKARLIVTLGNQAVHSARPIAAADAVTAVSRDTYRLFDLESGVPTDAYSMEEAVRDGFLVPPEAVSVPLKYQREGIRYDQLSEDEKDQWDALEWDEEDGDPPGNVGAEAINAGCSTRTRWTRCWRT